MVKIELRSPAGDLLQDEVEAVGLPHAKHRLKFGTNLYEVTEDVWTWEYQGVTTEDDGCRPQPIWSVKVTVTDITPLKPSRGSAPPLAERAAAPKATAKVKKPLTGNDGEIKQNAAAPVIPAADVEEPPLDEIADDVKKKRVSDEKNYELEREWVG